MANSSSGGGSGRKPAGGRKRPSSSKRKRSTSKKGAPKRKSTARKSTARKSTARKRSRRRGIGKGWKRLFRDLARWVLLRVGAVLTGAALGVLVVVGVLYRQALADVDDLLERPVWSEAGQVLSGPIELWPGLTLSLSDLAADLQRAGYARVPMARQPGDFEVKGDRIRVLRPAASGPGWTVKAGEAVITVADGRVALAGGASLLRLAPTQLAGVRGPDNEARRPVSLDELPPYVIDAVLAMEDARFRQHEGLDPLGIARALLVNAWAGKTVQGGSTLTQQLVKNLFLTQERSYERKAREALLAIALEQRRSKEEILELYLNEIYLGQAGGAAVCGVDQAARAYFGKPATRLAVGEAAAIAGMISAPNRYSPLRHPEVALERRDLALSRMAEVGFLTGQQARDEQAAPLQVHALTGGRRAPWVVDAAISQVESELGEGAIAARGLTVYTTINPVLQRLAEQAVAEAGAELDETYSKAAGAQIALAAVRVSDGAVVALVGGRDYGSSQFDRASDGRRQVGSTVKPLTWLFAFEGDANLSPATVLQDEPLSRVVDGKTWSPQNYDGVHVGPISLRQALVTSRNVPAVLLAEQVGLGTLERRWKSVGLSTATDWPSAALGSFGATPLEVAGAYTVFPRGGTVVSPTLLRGVTDVVEADAEPTLLLDNTAVEQQRVATAQASFMAADILREVVTRGTGRRAGAYGVRGPVGGKTGTTDDGRDAWFAGFTDELAVAVWVGFDCGRDLGLTGSQAALPAWARFVAASGTMQGKVRPPSGLERVEVCAETGAPACPGPFARSCDELAEDWFQTGHSPECGAQVGGGRESLVDRLRRELGGARSDDEGEQVDGADADSADDKTRRGLFRRKRR